LAGVLCIACGNGFGSEGAVREKPLDARGGFLLTSAGNGRGAALLTIANREDFCGYLEAANLLNYTTYLEVALAIVSSNGDLIPPDAPGRYELGKPVTPSSKISAFHFTRLGGCNDRTEADAQSGWVQIDSLKHVGPTVTAASGTFFADFGPDGRLQGSFDATDCAGPFRAVVCR
jgi:hypothetical protein